MLQTHSIAELPGMEAYEFEGVEQDEKQIVLRVRMKQAQLKGLVGGKILHTDSTHVRRWRISTRRLPSKSRGLLRPISASWIRRLPRSVKNSARKS